MAYKKLLLFSVHFSLTVLLVNILTTNFHFISVCYYSRAVNWIVGSVIAVSTFRFTKKKYLNDEVSTERKTVLITGCDTGFGHLFAKRLDSKGFSVIACCLFPNDNGAKELQKSCSERLKVVGLDVTKDESVSQVKEFVTKNLEDSELWAIVNNAGILKGVTIELTSLRDFKDSLEVNTLGVVRVTQAFLPLLRKSKGRVVNLTSVAGRITLMYMGAYYMSKHAAVAFNDCLRKEMEVWGVRVISIEPDFFGTPLLDDNTINKMMDKTFSSLSDDVSSDYGDDYLQAFKTTKKYLFFFANSSPKKVIDALDCAVTLKYPDSVYEPRASILTTIMGFVYVRIRPDWQDFIMKVAHIILRLPKPKAS